MTSNTLNYNINFNQNNNINNNFVIIEEKGKNTLDNFIKKYKCLLELIIVYGYFIRKLGSKIIKTKFLLLYEFIVYVVIFKSLCTNLENFLR